jgi:hypothetical protein
MSRPRIPSWYWAVLLLTLGIVAALQLAYVLGAGGVSVGGADVDFGRKYDRMVFAIDDARGFAVGGEDDIAIVKTRPGMPPFRPVCGRCELAGSILPAADYMHGDWVYSEWPDITDVDAVNLVTGETLVLDVPRSAPGKPLDPATVPEYVARGLDFAAEKKLTPRHLAGRYEDGRLIQESCLVLQMAGMLCLAIVAVIGLVLLVIPRRR